MIHKNQNWLKLLIFVFTSVNVSAQIPGYMGKRTVIGYGFHFHPAIGGISKKQSDRPFNFKQEGYIEQNITERASVGVSVQFYDYVYNNSLRADPIKRNSRISYSGIKPNGTYQIDAQNVVLYGKIFKRAFLAPWGPYFTLGIVYTQYKTEYKPSEMYVVVENSNGTQKNVLNDFGPLQQKFRTADVVVGLGRSRIFGDIVVVDWGCNMQTISTTWLFLSADVGRAYYMDEYIRVSSLRRVRAINLIHFYMRLGLLF